MPNRIIKDSICRSDDYKALTLFQRDFFIRLIVTVDDYGRYDARPSILKGQMYPLEGTTEATIEEALKAMSTLGIVLLYSVEGRPYLQLTSWQKHQTIRAKKSRYPAPSAVDSVDNITCIHLKSNACKCVRNPIQSDDDKDCYTCSLSARAHEIDGLYRDLYPGKELIWADVLTLAKQMLPFEIPLVRKAVLLTHTSSARDPVAYLFSLIADWNARGIRTFEDFRTSKGAG